MIRIFVNTSLILAMATALACASDKPKGTTPPGEGGSGESQSAANADGSATGEASTEGNGEAAATDGGAAPAENVEKKVCEAEVGSTPTALFAESMLLRLPKGLAPEAVVEESPMFARARPFESTGCIEGLSGAMVNFTAMGYFQEDEKKSMQQFRDETLKQLGFMGNLKYSDEAVAGRRIEVAVEIPPDPANNHPDPGKAWFVLKAGFGRMYYVVYEVHPRAWNAIKKTLKASTDRLLLREPG